MKGTGPGLVLEPDPLINWKEGLADWPGWKCARLRMFIGNTNCNPYSSRIQKRAASPVMAIYSTAINSTATCILLSVADPGF